MPKTALKPRREAVQIVLNFRVPRLGRVETVRHLNHANVLLLRECERDIRECGDMLRIGRELRQWLLSDSRLSHVLFLFLYTVDGELLLSTPLNQTRRNQ